MSGKSTIILLTFLCFTVNMQAQLSTRQAGLRLGYRGGLFYQAGSETGNAETAYNAMLSFSNNGLQLTGLKVIYETTAAGISPNLYLGWGYGGHAGFIYSNHIRSFGEDYYFNDHRFCPLIGVDGFLTAEYRIRDIPLIVSMNLKPFIEITIPAFVRVVPLDLGVSISYVF